MMLGRAVGASSFGVDAQGELYLVGYGGTMFKFEPGPAP
jgi:hypothetical protein